MNSQFLNSIWQDEALQRQMMAMLAVENQAFVQLSADLRISSLTEGAKRILRADVLQPIREILSGYTCEALELCLQENQSAHLRETIDGIGYGIEVQTVHQSLLMRLIPKREELNLEVISQFATHQTNNYIATLLALTAQLEAGKPEQQAEIKAKIHKNSLRILRAQRHAALLREMQSEYELHLQMHDAAAFCRAIIEKLPKGRVQVELRAPEHCLVVFDEALMQQAVCNLLTNAILTAERKVLFSLWHTGRRVNFGIADDGSGMTAERMEEMCSGWRALQEGTVGEAIGYGQQMKGLGLPLAEHIAGLHSGILLSYQNEPAGTRVVLSIPDDLEALHLLRQPSLRIDTGIDMLEMEFSVL